MNRLKAGEPAGDAELQSGLQYHKLKKEIFRQDKAAVFFVLLAYEF